jgi:hypothetical protein
MTITNKQAFLRLMDKCDIYFEDSLISKERIVQKYAEFIASSFGEHTHSLSVAQHTGSVCFDVVSFLIAALGCLALNETDNDEVVRSFEDGQIVLLSGDKIKERCLWHGFVKKGNSSDFEVSDFDDAEYAVLEQPSISTKKYVPRNRWNRISPYNGTSTRTDGRGLRRAKSNRNEFISYLFEVPIASIPSVVGVSTVIVTDREVFRRIADGVRVEYGEGKSIGLLDLVTVSYYTSNLEEHQYGANPAKTEPSLKITSRISAARDLVLDKSGNKTIGFMVIGTDTVASGNSELTELLERKSLKFSMLTSSIDSDVAQKIIESQNEASIFVCTKEFLLQHSEFPKMKNSVTTELNSQIENIINNDVSLIAVEGMCSWQEIKTLKNALFTIKRSDIRSEEKDDFIVTAQALINLILTAVFPLECLNKALECAEFVSRSRAIAPLTKLSELWRLADKPTELIDQFLIVADIIDRLYHSVWTACPKYDALLDLLGKYADKRIAIVVPKAYYVDMLKLNDSINKKCAAIVTANRFNGSERYDAVIAVGDFSGSHFNPLKCRAASDILILLYDGEERSFRYKKRKADLYEKNINARLSLETDGEEEDEPIDDSEFDDVAFIVAEDSNLNQYINTITSFDVCSFAQRMSGYSGNAPASEVYAVGHFLSGEQILFTRYYQAVVFDEEGETIEEKDVDSLQPGDTVVFAKRDDNTKNMVDYIYEQLHKVGRLSDKVLDATEKAQYWKLALREYKDIHGLSYRDLVKRLRGFGSSIQEVSVRQWLIEESHIVGPREENTLVQIANLTQDPFLLKSPHAYFEACEIVRKQRKNILKLIEKAIVDRFRGFVPTDDKLLGFIFENVEALSETLDLEYVSVLDKPVSVPFNFTNRPINDTEVRL